MTPIRIIKWIIVILDFSKGFYTKHIVCTYLHTYVTSIYVLW